MRRKVRTDGSAGRGLLATGLVVLISLVATAQASAVVRIETPPTITGEFKVDAVLSGWPGDSRPLGATDTVQWMRCSAAGADCASIVGAVNPAYPVQPDDAGGTLVLHQTATSANGRNIATRDSAPTPVIDPRPKGAPPPVPDPLVNLTLPGVFGRAMVGQTLTGFPGVWSSGLPLQFGYQWRRCATLAPCTDIEGASAPGYAPVAADVGRRIQLRVTAHSGDTTAVRESEPTEAVAEESRAFGTTPPAPAHSERMIDPFPVVRIRGQFSVRWTRFTLVTVDAPVGAVIAMKCAGRGCVFRNRRRTVSTSALVRIAALERRLAPGARLVLRVIEPGHIGKYTRITVRSGRPPARQDRCVMPESSDPVACPSS